MKAILFVSVMCMILNFSSSNENNEEIFAVSLFYRHGDRPPMSFYPNDPYQDPSLWSAPLGELTNMGKMQHFKLGKWLRNRYNGFLSPIYDREQIYIHSSNNDRCLMSASANLAGLYTPILKDIWNENLSWQPIPIHTAPEKNDDIVEVPDSCFIYNFLREKAQSEVSYFRNINQENEKFFEYLSKQTGSNISNFVEASYIYNTLNSEKIHNFTLPSWSLEVYPHLKELGDTAPKLFTATPQLTRLFIGRYFNDVLDQFKFHSGRIERKSESFRIFSGHDDQVFSILSALKVPKLEAVPYAAVIILELKRSSNGDFFVELLYKTEENVADVLKIPNCDEHCSFDNFIEIVQPIALTEEEFDEECKIRYSHIDLYYD